MVSFICLAVKNEVSYFIIGILIKGLIYSLYISPQSTYTTVQGTNLNNFFKKIDKFRKKI